MGQAEPSLTKLVLELELTNWAQLHFLELKVKLELGFIFLR